MGIFHSGDETVNITGQAIGDDSDTEAPGAFLRGFRAARHAVESEHGTDVVNDDVTNTGTGSVNITNSTVSGRHIGRQRL